MDQPHNKTKNGKHVKNGFRSNSICVTSFNFCNYLSVTKRELHPLIQWKWWYKHRRMGHFQRWEIFLEKFGLNFAKLLLRKSSSSLSLYCLLLGLPQLFQHWWGDLSLGLLLQKIWKGSWKWGSVYSVLVSGTFRISGYTSQCLGWVWRQIILQSSYQKLSPQNLEQFLLDF